MDLPACFFDSSGSFTLAVCEPWGWGIADWAKVVGLTIIALLTWIYRALVLPLVKWPFRNLRNRPRWPRISNEYGRTQREMIGREGTLERLREILTEGNPAALTNNRSGVAAVRGSGGVGKTLAAHAYIEKYKSKYEVIWIVAAETLDGIHESLEKLAQKVGLQIDAKSTGENAAIDTLQIVAAQFEKVLILYDNVPTPKHIQRYLVGRNRIHYLITSRHDDWTNIALDLPVGLLSEPAALKLLALEADRSEEELQNLVQALDHLPLALVIAGAYLRSNPSITAEEYRRTISAHLHDAPENDDYQASLYGAVVSSYERLNDLAQSLLNLCSFFSPDHIDPDFIACDDDKNELIPEPLKKIATNKIEISRVFSQLRSAGLIERALEGEASHVMHRLTSSAIRQKLSDNEAYEVWATAATALALAKMPRSALLRPEVWPDCIAPVAHAAALSENGPKEKIGKMLLSRLLLSAAEYPDARGTYQVAEHFLKIALTLSTEVTNEDALQVCAILNLLGSILEKQNKLKEAQELLEKAATIGRDQKDKKILGGVLMNLAGVFWRKNQLKSAETLMMEVREMVLEEYGQSSYEMSAVINNLSRLNFSLGKTREAYELSVEGTQLSERLFGYFHPDVALTYNNRAVMEASQGNWASAIEYIKKSIAIRLQLNLDDHPHTTASLTELAGFLRFSGREKEIEPLQKDVRLFLRDVTQTLVDKHEMFISNMKNFQHPT